MKHSHRFTRIVVTVLLIPVFLATTVGNLAWAGPIQNAQDALKAYKDLVPSGTRGVGMFTEAINCFALALEITKLEMGDSGSGDLGTFADKCRFDINDKITVDANGAIQQGLVNLTGALIWALAENLRRHKEPKKPLPGSIE